MKQAFAAPQSFIRGRVHCAWGSCSVLTSKTVISTGMMYPALSAVLALYSLQNAMMFTPLAPRAGAHWGRRGGLPSLQCQLDEPHNCTQPGTTAQEEDGKEDT